MLKVLRWACCARAAHHGVFLSCLAEFANGGIKGKVKSKVTRNEDAEADVEG